MNKSVKIIIAAPVCALADIADMALSFLETVAAMITHARYCVNCFGCAVLNWVDKK